MRFSRVVSVSALCAAALWAGAAGAFLETGTLLTNSASATYRAGTEGTSLSYSATAKILIANPAMFLYKNVNPTSVGLVGGYITYTISFSNGGANTAFAVTIYDKLPSGGGGMKLSTCSATGYSAWVVGGSTPVFYASVDGSIWNSACPGSVPVDGSEYFRWTISQVGIGASGAITMVMYISP